MWRRVSDLADARCSCCMFLVFGCCFLLMHDCGHHRFSAQAYDGLVVFFWVVINERIPQYPGQGECFSRTTQMETGTSNRRTFGRLVAVNFLKNDPFPAGFLSFFACLDALPGWILIWVLSRGGPSAGLVSLSAGHSMAFLKADIRAALLDLELATSLSIGVYTLSFRNLVLNNIVPSCSGFIFTLGLCHGSCSGACYSVGDGCSVSPVHLYLFCFSHNLRATTPIERRLEFA